MKKGGFSLFIMLVLLAGGISGCKKEQLEDSKYHIFYINSEATKIEAVPFQPKSNAAEDLIKEMLYLLSTKPEDTKYMCPIKGDLEILEQKLEDNQLHIKFSGQYAELDNITEVLLRAAVVRTLTQIGGVDCVYFYVGDAPLLDQNGNPIGIMTADSFVENPGEQINAIQLATITLYFANKKGTALVKEVLSNVPYNSNISMEKLVMEYLLKGPNSKNAIAAIPQATKLVSVSVLDGICFINLDSGFLDYNFAINEEIVVYSIVNSLVELTNVNKVQISVNGDTSITYRDKLSLAAIYERNLDFLETTTEEE
jgi:germination protein M